MIGKKSYAKRRSSSGSFSGETKSFNVPWPLLSPQRSHEAVESPEHMFRPGYYSHPSRQGYARNHTLLRSVFPVFLQCHFSFQLVPRLARLLDRTFVLNGGDITWLTIERDCAQHTAHDLAAACLGQRAHKIELADDHDRTQFTAHRAQQFFVQVLRGLMPLPEHDKCRNHFAAQFIGTANHP